MGALREELAAQLREIHVLCQAQAIGVAEPLEAKRLLGALTPDPTRHCQDDTVPLRQVQLKIEERGSVYSLATADDDRPRCRELDATAVSPHTAFPHGNGKVGPGP